MTPPIHTRDYLLSLLLDQHRFRVLVVVHCDDAHNLRWSLVAVRARILHNSLWAELPAHARVRLGTPPFSGSVEA